MEWTIHIKLFEMIHKSYFEKNNYINLLTHVRVVQFPTKNMYC